MNWVYLDTFVLSKLVRSPGPTDLQRLVDVLDRRELSVGLSLVHLIELSRPDFVSGPAVATLLDALPVVWLESLDEVFNQEMQRAVAKLYGHDEPVRFGGPAPAVTLGSGTPDVAPSDVLNAFRDSSPMQAEFYKAVIQGIVFDSLKKDATLIKDPLGLLRHAIETRQPKLSPMGLLPPRPWGADEVIDAAGGLGGFPAYQVVHRLLSVRLRDNTYRAESNDVVDVWHAAYSPYAACTVLDRGTAARVREMKPPYASRVHSTLEAALEYLEAA